MRASSRALSTISCGNRRSSEASIVTPLLRAFFCKSIQWRFSISSSVTPAGGASGPITIRLVSRMSASDLSVHLLVLPQPRSSRRTTRCPSMNSSSWSSTIERRSGSEALLSISAEVTRRFAVLIKAYCSTSDLHRTASRTRYSDFGRSNATRTAHRGATCFDRSSWMPPRHLVAQRRWKRRWFPRAGTL